MFSRYWLPCIMGCALVSSSRCSATIITNGLIHLWKLDETSGTVAHDSVGSTDLNLLQRTGGGLNNNAGGPFLGQPGVQGTAIRFDGVDDYLKASVFDSSFVANNFTFSAWISFTGNYYKPGLANFGSVELILGPINNGPLFAANSLTGNYPKESSWHLVTLVKEANFARLYVDATQTASGGFGASGSPNGLTLGGDGSSHVFGGVMDDVAIYNRALSPAEVATNASAVPEPSAALLLLVALPFLKRRLTA